MVAIGMNQPSRTALGSKSVRVSALSRWWWITFWVVGTALPFGPFLTSMVKAALADTPYAYLMWIPIFSFAWAALSLRHVPSYSDDRELNAIVGVFITVTSGIFLYYGSYHWAFRYVANGDALLLWPLWGLGLAWLFFGVGVTRFLWKPLAYLMLCWTPLYTEVVRWTNPRLETMDNALMRGLFDHFSWVRLGSTYGSYDVFGHSKWSLLIVSSPCSGADSFLAMVVWLPVLLVAFKATWQQRTLLIVLGAVMAICLNWMRLIGLVAATHWFGPGITFGWIHPVLGAVLFAVALTMLLLIGHRLGLKPKSPQKDQQHLKTPGVMRSGFGALSIATLTGLLLPLYLPDSGTVVTPIPTKTEQISRLMPANMPGYQRQVLLRQNESSLFGAGSYGEAYSYMSRDGYALLAEEFRSYQLSALQSYGVDHCLLFHGNTILASRQYSLRRGITADAFIISLPVVGKAGRPSLYVDLSYIYAVQTNGKTAYLRAEFAGSLVNSSQRQGDRHNVASLLPVAFSETGGARWSRSNSHWSASVQAREDKFFTFVQTFAKFTLPNPSATQ